MGYILSGPPSGDWTLIFTEIAPDTPHVRVTKTRVNWLPDQDACELVYLGVLDDPRAELCIYLHAYAIDPEGNRHKLE